MIVREAMIECIEYTTDPEVLFNIRRERVQTFGSCIEDIAAFLVSGSVRKVSKAAFMKRCDGVL